MFVILLIDKKLEGMTIKGLHIVIRNVRSPKVPMVPHKTILRLSLEGTGTPKVVEGGDHGVIVDARADIHLFQADFSRKWSPDRSIRQALFRALQPRIGCIIGGFELINGGLGDIVPLGKRVAALKC